MPKKEKKRSLDTKPGIKVVTQNDFITSVAVSTLSVKARKLLYLAVAQDRKDDKEFYKFTVTPLEFADLMGIDPSNVYDSAKAICEELRPIGLRCKIGERHDRVFNLFSYVEYGADSEIVFKINEDVKEFFLDLKRNFTQPLLEDFMRMKSPYSMAIWHLCQREMKSKKPYAGKVIEFDLDLSELRQVTNTTEKKTYDKLIHFKEKVFGKALREIKDNCLVSIEYVDIKKGRKVVGFHCIAKSLNWLNADPRPRS